MQAPRTVEMRASLLREDVRACWASATYDASLQQQHVPDRRQTRASTRCIDMGSAAVIVHRQPGGSLCIVAVQAQSRGRLFLPFADDDPRTAEVVSKVLLLARDHEIQDPTILEQLR